MNPIDYFICGGFGGICNVLVGHPLDTVKVRLQTMVVPSGGTPPYTGTWDCISKTLAKEGPLGLYKGISAPLIGVAPIFALSFFGFGVGRQIFEADREDYKDLRTLAAGAFSGMSTAIIASPAERVKCLLQIQEGAGEKKYNGSGDAIKKLYQEGGIRSIYRGFCATLVRDIPGAGSYFLTYGFLTRVMSNPGEPVQLPISVFAGGMAGVVNWTIAMPADVIKSRIQTAPEGTLPGGVIKVFFELLKQDGIGSMFKGFTPVMLRSFPANAACFLGFEIAAKVLKKFKGE